jgi:hypothetical protein
MPGFLPVHARLDDPGRPWPDVPVQALSYRRLAVPSPAADDLPFRLLPRRLAWPSSVLEQDDYLSRSRAISGFTTPPATSHPLPTTTSRTEPFPDDPDSPGHLHLLPSRQLPLTQAHLPPTATSLSASRLTSHPHPPDKPVPPKPASDHPDLAWPDVPSHPIPPPVSDSPSRTSATSAKPTGQPGISPQPARQA